MRIRTVVLLTVLVVAPAARARAHHTVANTVDISRLVSLAGRVTSIEWKNPHVIYHLAVPNPGVAGWVDWEIESRHVQGMRMAGIDEGTIKVGDRLTMNVMLAKDGSHHAATASVVLPDGRKIDLCTVTNHACPR